MIPVESSERVMTYSETSFYRRIDQDNKTDFRDIIHDEICLYCLFLRCGFIKVG